MHQDAASSDILDRAAQFYTDHLTAPVLGYLADRGFPEAFVRQRRIGYAPVSSSSRNLLVREIRSTTRSNGTRLLQEAIEAGLVVQDKTGTVRDFFASETTGYVLFPTACTAAWSICKDARIPRPPGEARTSTYPSRSATCTMPAMRASAR